MDRIIGVGGFGVVAAATHLELRQEVAIKMLKPEFTDDAEIVDRFLREARAVAGLRTDHVCRVFDVARTEAGAPYIVMELLVGTDVGVLVKQQPLPPAVAVEYIVQACVALAEAHPRGIVHRDLKPPNLFTVRRPDGSVLVKVLDFGIAKAADELRLTHSMTMLGSPQYMSPEQLTTPKTMDHRSDIWSLGVSLYHMIARALPFRSAQLGELAVMITAKQPSPIDSVVGIDPGLCAVIWRCLEKQREARYPDVGALAAALAPFGTPATRGYAARCGGGPHTSASMSMPARIETPPALPPPQVPTIPTLPSASVPQAMSAFVPAPSPQRSRGLLVGGLAVAVLALGGAIGYVATRGSAKSARNEAPAARELAAASPDVDAAVPIAVPTPAPSDAAVPVVATPPSIDPALREEYEQGLLDVEERIRRFEHDPPTVQVALVSAVQMSCALGQVARAKAYLAKLVDPRRRAAATEACRSYKLAL